MKPFKYTVICNTTKKQLWQSNQPPLLQHLQSYVPTANSMVLKLEQTKTCFIDTRYDAKLRLYKYVMFKKYGVKL